MPSVLFIHHGTLHGGAPLSLLYTAQGVREAGYEVTIGLVKNDVDLHNFYASKDFATVNLSFIYCYYYHAASSQMWSRGYTYRNLIRAGIKWRTSKNKLKAFLKSNSYDIVHLNSVALINSAEALEEIKQQYVWHVREYGPKKKGFRYSFFSKKLLQCQHVIFLSVAEQISWLGSTNHGSVVHNFIDLDHFTPSNTNRKQNRQDYNIEQSTFVILFLGGFKEHKGIDEVFRAIRIIKDQLSSFQVIMPGTLIGNHGPYVDRMKELGIYEYCRLDGFVTDIRGLLCMSDVLIFPATVPHFARPVIEAAAMEIPSIAADLEPMDELILNGETGLLFDPGDAMDLAKKIILLSRKHVKRKEMGLKGRRLAVSRFNKSSQILKILNIYKDALR